MQQAKKQRLFALPIFLLVLGALSVGFALWFLIAQPASILAAAFCAVCGLILLVAGGMLARANRR